MNMGMEYYKKRIASIRKTVNILLTLLTLKRQQIEAIPLSDLQDLEISAQNVLFRETKPRQIDSP